MPFKLEIKMRLPFPCDCLHCLDLHPTEPWMLLSHSAGPASLYNLENQQLLKTLQFCDCPVKKAIFIPRKNWIIGSLKSQLVVFECYKFQLVHSFAADLDYIDCIITHPTKPYVLTSGGECIIKLWNWESQWALQQVFDAEHSKYIFQIAIDPKDNDTFASVSWDGTLNVWQLNSPSSNFTLEADERGVNCLDYYPDGEKSYIISGGEDGLVKIWNYPMETCVQTLVGHTKPVSAVFFHAEFPSAILTGSEDGTVRAWDAKSYQLIACLNFGYGGVWSIACVKGSKNVAIGFEEGIIVVELGNEEPAM